MNVLTPIILALLTVAALTVRCRLEGYRPRLEWVWTRWSRLTPGRLRAAQKALMVSAVAGVLAAQTVLAPPAHADICSSTEAPLVDFAGSGLTGMIDPPLSMGIKGEPHSVYFDYMYAGMTWYTYDLGCSDVEFGTLIGNYAFRAAKGEVAVSNSLNYTLAEESNFDWLTDLIKKLAPFLFNGIVNVWAPLILIILGVILLTYAFRGDSAGAVKRFSWGFLGLWIAACCAFVPLTYNTFFRDTMVNLTGQAQAGFFDGKQDRNIIPTTLVDTVIYQNWLAGEFGDPTGDVAKQYGPKLLDAQACTLDERLAQTCESKAKDKQAAYKEIASPDKLGSSYPIFQGKNGGTERVSAGFTALFQGTWLSLFQIVSRIVMAISIIVIGLMILLGPATGLMGMVNADTLRSLLRAVGTAILNSIIAGLLCGLHVQLILFVIQSKMIFPMQAIAMIIATWFMLAVLRPIKRIRTMFAAAMDITGQTFPDRGVRFLGRPRGERALTAAEEFFQRSRDQADTMRKGPGLWDRMWDRWGRAPQWGHTVPEAHTAGPRADGPAPRGTAVARPAYPGMPGVWPGYAGAGAGAGDAGRTYVRATASRIYPDAPYGPPMGMGGSMSGGPAARTGLLGRLGAYELPHGAAPVNEQPPAGADSPAPSRPSMPALPSGSTPAAGPAGMSEANQPPVSSLGMVDTDPTYYSAGEAESTGTVFSATRDGNGVWVVGPPETDNTANLNTNMGEQE